MENGTKIQKGSASAAERAVSRHTRFGDPGFADYSQTELDCTAGRKNGAYVLERRPLHHKLALFGAR